MKHHNLAIHSLALAALFAAGSASAAIVTSRAAMGGDDFIDWWQAPVSYSTATAHGLTSPLSVVSDQGVSATVSNTPSPGMWRVVQSCGGYGGFQFAANFAACDRVLLSQNTYNPDNRISISFSTAVAGGGAQFADAATYGPFTAFVSAYDILGNLLESVNLGGTTTGAGDNSAIFLGISRQQADIARLDFSASGFNRYFGINRVELDLTAPSPPPPPPAPPPNGSVPEPSTLMSVALALPLALWTRRRAVAKRR